LKWLTKGETDFYFFEFKSLGQLHELHIGGNLLENLSSGVFTGMERLEKLFILSNNLRDIDSEAFIGLPQLLWLALNNNLLTTLPHDVFEPVPKLQRMSVIQPQNIKKDEIYYYFFLSFFH
jgi:Leucine-rich repeat (LRR) protein